MNEPNRAPDFPVRTRRDTVQPTERERIQIPFELLSHKLWRCGEIATIPGMAEEIIQLYTELLAPLSDTFRTAHAAVKLAKNEIAAKRLAVRKSLAEFDPVYGAARVVALAFVPTMELPESLKTQRTDTHIVLAMTDLVAAIESHAGNAWVDKLKAGRFGTLVPKVQTVLNESLAATHGLRAARLQRSEAYVPAYQGYLAFKNLVRVVLGPSSPEYRRLHPRAAGTSEIDPEEIDSEEVDPAELEPAEEAAPDSGVMPASNGTPALAGGSPVKVA